MFLSENLPLTIISLRSCSYVDSETPLVNPQIPLADCVQNGDVYIRSTAIGRTVESMQSALGGLGSSASAVSPLPLYTIEGKEDYVWPSTAQCTKLSHIHAAGAERFKNDPLAGSTVEQAACARAMDYLTDRIVARIQEQSTAEPFGTRLGETSFTLTSLRTLCAEKLESDPASLSFINIRDVIATHKAENAPVPEWVTEDAWKALDIAATREFVALGEGHGPQADSVNYASNPVGFPETPEGEMALRLGIGRFLQEILLRLDQSAFAHALHTAAHSDNANQAILPSWATADAFADLVAALDKQQYFPHTSAGLQYVPTTDNNDGLPAQSVPRLSLTSAHNTTLIPLLMALNTWDGDSIPFASNLTVELYSTAAPAPFYTTAAAAAPVEAQQEKAAPADSATVEAPESVRAHVDEKLAPTPEDFHLSSNIDPETLKVVDKLLSDYIDLVQSINAKEAEFEKDEDNQPIVPEHLAKKRDNLAAEIASVLLPLMSTESTESDAVEITPEVGVASVSAATSDKDATKPVEASTEVVEEVSLADLLRGQVAAALETMKPNEDLVTITSLQNMLQEQQQKMESALYNEQRKVLEQTEEAKQAIASLTQQVDTLTATLHNTLEELKSLSQNSSTTASEIAAVKASVQENVTDLQTAASEAKSISTAAAEEAKALSASASEAAALATQASFDAQKARDTVKDMVTGALASLQQVQDNGAAVSQETLQAVRAAVDIAEKMAVSADTAATIASLRAAQMDVQAMVSARESEARERIHDLELEMQRLATLQEAALARQTAEIEATNAATQRMTDAAIAQAEERLNATLREIQQKEQEAKDLFTHSLEALERELEAVMLENLEKQQAAADAATKAIMDSKHVQHKYQQQAELARKTVDEMMLYLNEIVVHETQKASDRVDEVQAAAERQIDDMRTALDAAVEEMATKASESMALAAEETRKAEQAVAAAQLFAKEITEELRAADAAATVLVNEIVEEVQETITTALTVAENTCRAIEEEARLALDETNRRVAEAEKEAERRIARANAKANQAERIAETRVRFAAQTAPVAAPAASAAAATTDLTEELVKSYAEKLAAKLPRTRVEKATVEPIPVTTAAATEPTAVASPDSAESKYLRQLQKSLTPAKSKPVQSDEALLQDALFAMNLSDTPVNRTRAVGYIQTFGPGYVMQVASTLRTRKAESAVAVAAKTSGTEESSTEAMYVQRLLELRKKNKAPAKPEAAVPVAAESESKASLLAPLKQTLTEVYTAAASRLFPEQGLRAPLAESAKEPEVVAPAPVVETKPVETKKSPSHALDDLYLALIRASPYSDLAKEAAVAADASADIFVPEVTTPAEAAATAVVDGHDGYLDRLIQSFKESVHKTFQAVAAVQEAPAPTDKDLVVEIPTPVDPLVVYITALDKFAKERAIAPANYSDLDLAKRFLEAYEKEYNALHAEEKPELMREALAKAEQVYLESLRPNNSVIAFSASSAVPADGSAPEYYVRILYNGKPIPLPLPSKDGKGEYIPLSVFRAAVARYIPIDFHTECAGGAASGPDSDTIPVPKKGVPSVNYPTSATLPEFNDDLKQTLRLGSAYVPSRYSALANAPGVDVAATSKPVPTLPVEEELTKLVEEDASTGVVTFIVAEPVAESVAESAAETSLVDTEKSVSEPTSELIKESTTEPVVENVSDDIVLLEALAAAEKLVALEKTEPQGMQ